MRKHFYKTTVFDDGKNPHTEYVTKDELKSTIGKDRNLTPEMYEYLKEKIKSLNSQIDKMQEILHDNALPDDPEPLGEWETLMIKYYQDECRIDLREDELLIEHKGFIPKHIDERCIKRAEEIYAKYDKMLGRKKFLQLKDDVDEMIRGDVNVDIDPTSGGGKR